MEVKINKEIRNYTESMFFGLSMRQFIFSVLACGVAVALYFLLRPYFGTETLSWMCILGAKKRLTSTKKKLWVSVSAESKRADRERNLKRARRSMLFLFVNLQ